MCEILGQTAIFFLSQKNMERLLSAEIVDSNTQSLLFFDGKRDRLALVRSGVIMVANVEQDCREEVEAAIRRILSELLITVERVEWED